MDVEEYRKRGKQMVDYIADYLTNIRERRAFPDVEPGYMRELQAEHPPEYGEPWEDIFKDVERVIMPGITHWQSPHMHAYFPALNSYPSLLGDMLADGINCLGFTWASSPACTELEKIVMDWLADMLDLPSFFCHNKTNSKGGGVIQGTLSEATLVAMLAARNSAICRSRDHSPEFDEMEDGEICSRLVAYCSNQAHSSIEKNSLIAMVTLRHLPTDENLCLRGEALDEAIHADLELGLIPFFVCATLGTTGACAFDNVDELGQVCQKYDVWLHLDAAYAGSAFICPEFRHFIKGIERADTFAFNPSKWLLVHFDCTAFWIKDSTALENAFCVNPLYLRHHRQGAALDFMHWQIPLSRRFRALKLWFVLRSYGVKGLQDHIRKGVRNAKFFESLVRKDPAFEVVAERHLSLVCFRLKGPQRLTEELLRQLNATGKMYMVPASVKGKYIIRFAVTSTHTKEEDLIEDWELIKALGKGLLNGIKFNSQGRKSAIPCRNASWPVPGNEENQTTPNEEDLKAKTNQMKDINERPEKALNRRALSADTANYGFPFNAYYSLEKYRHSQLDSFPPAEECQEDGEDDVFTVEENHADLAPTAYVVTINNNYSPLIENGFEHKPNAENINADINGVFSSDKSHEDDSRNSKESSEIGKTEMMEDAFAQMDLSSPSRANNKPGLLEDVHVKVVSSAGRFGSQAITNGGAYNGVVNICHSDESDTEVDVSS